MSDLPLPQLQNQDLYKIAFTHRSALNEFPDRPVSNERLEFLGDAVLELTVSRYLYDQFPDEPEGILTSYRSSLVKTTTLAKVAKEYGLGQLLILSKGEEISGGRENAALLANTFEAYTGALYLDQGYEAADTFIKAAVIPKLHAIRKNKLYKDPKSTLQEHAQSKHQRPPAYKVISETGPDHQKEFIVAVAVGGQELGRAMGKSKQEAQQLAAEKALEKIKET
ncbi:MAG TPA: ribonuclease III [Candidatus Saccharimonadia bacterium]|nr:ribonuclease III [Candidatus Saccharimonadia bacterium]